MKYSVRTTHQLAMILQGCRKQAELSQKQASAKVGMLPKTISALEISPDNCTIASLFKLLSALDLEMVLQPKWLAQDNKDQGANDPVTNDEDKW